MNLKNTLITALTAVTLAAVSIWMMAAMGMANGMSLGASIASAVPVATIVAGGYAAYRALRPLKDDDES